MPVGIVKFFNDTKGYGFIKRHEADNDLFVRAVDIKGEGYRTLCVGQRVRFEVTRDDKGKHAANVEQL